MFQKAKAWIAQKKKAAVVACMALAAGVGFSLTGPAVQPAAAAPVSFTGTTLPFTVPDMLTTAVNFLTMYGEWILLALGVIFAPVLYGLAMKLVTAVKARTAKG